MLPASVISVEKPFNAKLTVKAETIVHKNVRHVSLSLQNVDASSSEKRSPPTGAPNAAETPGKW